VHGVLALLALPFVLRQNTWFEWENVLWLLQLQTEHVRAHGLPSWFIHAPDQVFYPHHVFYAGPLLAVLAYPSLVFGAWPVLAATCAASFAALSAGASWAARALGVPDGLALAPGVLLATTPFVVSDLYGRGAVTELVALAGVAVALGGACAVLAGRRGRAPTAGVMGGTALIAGSHNLTLAISVVLALPVLAVIVGVLAVPGGEARLRLAHVAVAALTGAALCGAFLVPNLWLGPDTFVTSGSLNRRFLESYHDAVTPDVVFDPLGRGTPSLRGSDVRTQTAVTAAIWVVVVAVGALARRRTSRRTAWSVLALAGTAAVLTTAIARPAWWLELPSALWTIQFTFRLVPYLALVIVLALVVLLREAAVASRRWVRATLAVAVGWQVVTATVQVVTAEARGPVRARPADVEPAVVPVSFADPGYAQAYQFRLDRGTPVARPPAAVRAPVRRDPPPDVVAIGGAEAPGTRLATNIVASPLVRVDGDARVVGRDRDGFAVLEVEPHDGPTWRAEVSPRCRTCASALWGDAPWPLLLGRVLTVGAGGGVVVSACRNPGPRARHAGGPAARTADRPGAPLR
jgi:hypothetical protein